MDGDVKTLTPDQKSDPEPDLTTDPHISGSAHLKYVLRIIIAEYQGENDVVLQSDARLRAQVRPIVRLGPRLRRMSEHGLTMRLGLGRTRELDEGLVLAGAVLEQFPGGGQARDLVLRAVQRQHRHSQVLAVRLHRLDSLRR